MGRIGCLILVSLACLCCGACGGGSSVSGTVYFLVAGEGHGDSYILPISDPAQVARAREIVADRASPGPRIVVAAIARGSGDGEHVNRDLIGGRAWSWHVTRCEGFADATIEILDGWPGYVEDHLEEWMATTGGRIGFWSYTVVREVRVDEMQ